MSSSEDPSAFLNPDLYARLSLSVEHADGSVTPIPDGGVILRAGTNLDLTVLPDEDTVSLAVEQSTAAVDPYYKQKYEALQALSDLNDALNPITGPFADLITGETPDGDPWSFTRASLWFGGINSRPADLVTGAFYLVTGPCAVAGSFPLPNNGSPELAEGTLKLFDICAPCVDCPTWVRLDSYVRRLAAFYDYILELIYNEDTANPPVHPDGGTPEAINGLLREYMTAVRYWDYLVHNSTLKLAAQASGQAVVTAAFYRNITPLAVAGVEIQLDFCFYKNGAVWAAVDSSVVSFKLLARTGVDMNAVYSGVPVWNAGCVTVNLAATGPLASNQSLYGDLVMMLDDTLLPADTGLDECHIELTATYKNTHLGTAVTKTLLIYFVPPAGSSI